MQAFGLGSIDIAATEYTLLNANIDSMDVSLRRDLEQEISEYSGTACTLIEGLIFLTPPGRTQDIHIDGNSISAVAKSRAALNIPLSNCDRSPMIWYRGNYVAELAELQGTKNIKLKWNTGPFEIARTVIDSPTLVRVEVPHHIHNPTNQSRISMSLRFDPPLGFK